MYAMLVDGRWLDGGGRAAAAVENPANGEKIGEVPLASEEDIACALAAARKGFEDWRSWSSERRARVLIDAAAILREAADELAVRLVAEQGKILREAKAEVAVSAEILEWSAAEGMRQYGRLIPSRDLAFVQTVRREPVGICVLVPSWNVPVLFAARKFAESLAAGCAAIMVGHKQTPSAAIAVAHALHEAGAPAGVVGLLFGSNAALLDKLLRAEGVSKVSFTGGTETGRQIARVAADRVLHTTLELGGHAPAIVFDDVDPERAAGLLVASKFRNAGQVCNSPTRIFVHRASYEKFLEAFVAGAARLTVGAGTDPSSDMGPLCGRRQLERTEAIVADAIDRGARLLIGGRRIGNSGWFYEPTALDRLAPESRLLHEEPFGPLAALLPFEDDREVIAQANALEYGLAGYAFTNSAARANLVSNELKVGMLGINTAQISLPETPFGGVRQSGIGSEGGTEGVASYMTTKYVSHLAA